MGAVPVVVEGSPWWAVARLVVVGLVMVATVRAAAGGRSWPRAMAGGLSGFVATTVGGALTLSYVGTDGHWRLAGGVLMLVGGMVLLVMSWADLWRLTRGWWRAVASVAVVVGSYVVGLSLVTATYATNVGRAALGPVTPADRGLEYVDASFSTADGVSLSGWYLPSHNGAAVVVAHGASENRTGVLDEAAVLARRGYGVLLFDARGSGRSGGRGMALGWYGEADIAAAVDYLAAQPGVDSARLGVFGESMGGESALGALAADPRLRAAVAEGATNRTSGDWAWLGDRYGVRGQFQRGVTWLTSGLTDLLTAARPPATLREAVSRAAPRPVLLIAAGNEADEAHAAAFISEGAPQSVEIWTVPGASHTGGLKVQPSEWEARVVGFFDATLTERVAGDAR